MSNTITQPKYKIDQKVKFVGDHEILTGAVLKVAFDSSLISDEKDKEASGWVYAISSRFYDAEINDMVEGHKICREEELEDMSHYDGSAKPAKPDKVVNLSDKTSK